ncbi:hypothetical protein [Pseudonocardia sp. H11422]|uniref:hypothetical protein n=1 Tax=Pseudonocardia sp. H11422 TaxID=2835866 RepID=UPI0027E2910F|nr:hypothetical protein [Pseudonocardia sp. H11422]
MSSIDSDVVLLTCRGGGSRRRFPFHGIRPASRAARVPAVLAHVPAVELPPDPGRTDIDPVLAEHLPRRLIVAGQDSDLGAVLVRLLRTERLESVEVAYLPASRSSAAAAAWGLPTDPAAAAALALDGTATPVPLIRDDVGGVLVGRGEIRGLQGEAYCDNTLVLRGRARRLVVAPGPEGVGVLAGRGVRAATGRAVQVGCVSATAVVDGREHPRAVPRWTWYRHLVDWRLVRP